MSTHTFGDDSLRIELIREEQAVRLALTDRATGRRRGPAPLLALSVYDKACRRTERYDAYRVDEVEPVGEAGAHVTIGHEPTGVRLGLWLRVEKGELAVRLPMGECYEDRAPLHRLFGAELLPGLAACGPGGTVVLPVSHGFAFDPADAPKASDRFLLYGEQPRWELIPLLPVCAAADPDAGGLVVLAREGAAETSVHVHTDGRGNGAVGMGFHLRSHWPDPVEHATREIRYVPMPPKTDPVLFAAKRVRRHAVEDRGMRPLRERIREDEGLRYLTESFTMKLFFGIERVGYMMEGRGGESPRSFCRCMTFDEATTWLERLRKAGLDKIYTQSTGWNLRGHDGLYPTRFPVEGRVGGETGFRRMLARGRDLGYRMSVHDNFLMLDKGSPDFDPDLAIRDLHGEPLLHGNWAGGPECSAWPLAFPGGWMENHLARMASLGVQGPYYCDYMPQPLEINYHPRHRGSRSRCAEGMARVVRAARQAFGAAGVEMGFFHILQEVDHVASSGNPWVVDRMHEDWPVKALLKRPVPLWNLAMHGLVVRGGASGIAWENALTTVVEGYQPRDEWALYGGVMPVMNETRIRGLKAIHDLTLGTGRNMALLELTGWSETADGVRTSDFEGLSLTADFNKKELFVDGTSVPRPEALPATGCAG